MASKAKHEPVRFKGLLHPSGRPRANSSWKGLSIERRPAEEPLTPRLRARELEAAIGFHAHIGGYDDE